MHPSTDVPRHFPVSTSILGVKRVIHPVLDIISTTQYEGSDYALKEAKYPVICSVYRTIFRLWANDLCCLLFLVITESQKWTLHQIRVMFSQAAPLLICIPMQNA